MNELLNSGRFGLGNKNKEDIVTTWEQTGLLEGVDDETVNEKIALTLEDVATKLISVADYTPYSPYSGRFDTVVFPITRRVFSDINKGTYSHIIKGDYEEMKSGLIDLITADFIIKTSVKLYIPTWEFFEEIYKDVNNVDVEAEATAFVAERVTMMYLREFNGQKIMKGDNGYFTIPESLNGLNN